MPHIALHGCVQPEGAEIGLQLWRRWRATTWQNTLFWQTMLCNVQVLKVVPQHKEALERLARLWLRVGRWQRALEVADRAAAAHACDFAAHALRADVLLCAAPYPAFRLFADHLPRSEGSCLHRRRAAFHACMPSVSAAV